MDITRTKAKRNVVHNEKIKGDWGKEENMQCCIKGTCSTVLFGNFEI
jgi:hypothetical protein